MMTPRRDPAITAGTHGPCAVGGRHPSGASSLLLTVIVLLISSSAWAQSVIIQDATIASRKANVTCSGGTCSLKVDTSGTSSSTPGSSNISQFGGTSVVNGGVAGLIGVGGNSASGSADSGNPVKIGGVVATSLPTAGANGNRFNVMVDKFGRLVTVANGDRALKQVCSSITLTSTTETTLCTAGATGVFLDLEHLSCSNTSATLVRADIRDATGGTVRKSMALAASGGGFEMNLHDAPWPQTTAANNWTVQLSGAVTDVRCQAVAMKNQ